MTKLTAAQRILLSKAAAREDGMATMPARLGKAAARRVGSSLVARKLLREINSKPGLPVWRRDVKGKAHSLVITEAGRAAVGGNGAVRDASTSRSGQSNRLPAARPAIASPRGGTKQALIVEMLSQEHGATLAALIDATGWLPHTTRAALTGLRKKGYVIERMSGTGSKASAYRLVGAANLAA